MIGELERFDLLEWQRQQDAKRAAEVPAPIIRDMSPILIFPSPNPLQRPEVLTLWEQYQMPILLAVGTVVAIAMFKR